MLLRGTPAVHDEQHVLRGLLRPSFERHDVGVEVANGHERILEDHPLGGLTLQFAQRVGRDRLVRGEREFLQLE